ncbi:hypothetical protein EV385_4563 [Krasilnikovia cinnamomea]|uniref:Uncharacterized protein n=1 Tax=Krasilnikovia cinnamomea TaxID=349313 RepID=A0A4Q7ZQ69_9ACTN|nr:hypothetical protein [Krasilnikovia cinnamomea]RZU52683.1 hypothetical protein EV385_4563 [Krasilnikovia cinnamomea]
MLGEVQVARVDAELLETFYARLRKCRDHCDGRRYVQHRTSQPHECDDRCRRHACVGLSASTIRQIHWILNGALDRAVRWKWIAINPAEQADKPALPHPDPQPPSVDEAARIVTEAWRDPDWGTFVDAETAAVPAEHKHRWQERLDALGLELRLVRVPTTVRRTSAGQRLYSRTAVECPPPVPARPDEPAAPQAREGRWPAGRGAGLPRHDTEGQPVPDQCAAVRPVSRA